MNAKKPFNNIYVKNFNPAWTVLELMDFFGKYGQIKSLHISKCKDKDGVERPFAFVCFDKEDDPKYGVECAEKAVSDVHGKEIGGFTLYA